MSTALTLAPDFTPEQMKLITDTVAKGATKEELQLFLYRCKSLGFDPLKSGQIHFVKYGSGPGTIVVGIDGFRTRAHRSGKLSGIKRGVLRDEKSKCIGAWAEVYRTDWQHPARVEVSLSEYSSGKGPWQKMPESMIQKVAEAAALRMAFPDDLGGIYAEEEMDQAKPVVGTSRIVAEQPGAEDGVQHDEYWIPYGPLTKATIESAHSTPERIAKLDKFITDIQDKAVRLKKPKPGWAQELIERVEAYRIENGLIEGENEPGWEE